MPVCGQASLARTASSADTSCISAALHAQEEPWSQQSGSESPVHCQHARPKLPISPRLTIRLGLSNLKHVLLNNSVHDSVGGQLTSASQGTQRHDFGAVAKAVGYASVTSARTAKELKAALASATKGGATGPAFIEASLSLGTRDDLGRPKTSTADAKAAFMGHLATTVAP